MLSTFITLTSPHHPLSGLSLNPFMPYGAPGANRRLSMAIAVMHPRHPPMSSCPTKVITGSDIRRWSLRYLKRWLNYTLIDAPCPNKCFPHSIAIVRLVSYSVSSSGSYSWELFYSYHHTCDKVYQTLLIWTGAWHLEMGVDWEWESCQHHLMEHLSPHAPLLKLQIFYSRLRIAIAK